MERYDQLQRDIAAEQVNLDQVQRHQKSCKNQYKGLNSQVHILPYVHYDSQQL